ncbi:MAG: HepT-like ribonuclease domain-containing protein [Anaerolineae bacterium]
MSTNAILEIPQDILDSARLTVDELRVELAVHLYAEGRLSIGKARELAEMTLGKFRSNFRADHADVPWTDVVGFRNIAVHEYFAVSWPIVWVTPKQDVPLLRQRIAAILVDEFGISLEAGTA